MEQHSKTACPAAFPSLAEFAHAAVARAVTSCVAGQAGVEGARCVVAVDATCGNGYDTRFLVEIMAHGLGNRPWHVFAFDVQEQAIANTRKSISTCRYQDRVALHLCSHDTVSAYIFPDKHLFIAGMFNLGFLPGSDKKVVTTPGATLAALDSIAGQIAPCGIISVHSYGGHAHGMEEMCAVDKWFSVLAHQEWSVAKYTIHNKTQNPEALYLAQKKGSRL